MPVRQAATALAVAETLGRNLLILKIKLSRRFDPIASGNPKLLDADPSNQVFDKLNALLANSKSAALARYLKLMDAVQLALNESIDTKALLSMRIVDLMPGLERIWRTSASAAANSGKPVPVMTADGKFRQLP